MIELARIHLDLIAIHGATFTQSLSRTLHAAIHRMLHEQDPAVAQQVHDAVDKPVVIGPMLHREDDAPLRQGCVSGTRVHLTVATLDAPVTATMLEGIDRRMRGSEPLIVGPVAWLIDAWHLEGPPHTAMLPRTYADLAAVPPVREVELEFVSPTVFRHGSEFRVTPTAQAVFGGYWRRWLAFSPCPLPLHVTQLEQQIGLDRQRTQPRTMDIGVAQQPAFTGWARYRIEGDDDFTAAVASLALYSAWCGTGARTAWGMGQSRARLLAGDRIMVTVNLAKTDGIVAKGAE